MFNFFTKSFTAFYFLLGIVLVASADYGALDKAGAVAMNKASFENLDTDNDGTITKNEAPGMIEKWDQIDSNADNVLSMDEFKSNKL